MGAERDRVEVSFVMPCLNEAETVAQCIQAAQDCIKENGLEAEVIVADNGSTDGSQAIARRCGARVVQVPERGYGNAIMGGFAAARGKYLIMGDADLSYDFGEVMPFIEKLREGYQLVMGSRFSGEIEAGAMPWSHRWIGNPVLSWLGRRLFSSRVSDFHCGLRALTKESYVAMGIRTTGMEFASEIVVKASVRGMRVAEVPITLHPDGRTHPPHLRSFRDGWRHLRFLLMLSPRWTLFFPGAILALVGVSLAGLVLFGPAQIGRLTLDVHTLIAGSLFTLVGYQTMTTAIAARIYALEEEIGPPAPWLERASNIFTLERGLIAGGFVVLCGLGMIGVLTWRWASSGFGPLDLNVTLRPMLVGSTLVALGIQTLLMSFVYGMLGIKKSRR